jgi:tetratricopeptide (TPR) repeat protein
MRSSHMMRSLWLRAGGACLAAAAAMITPAAADKIHDQVAVCANDDGHAAPEAAIKACTELLNALGQPAKARGKDRDQILDLEAEILKDRAKAYTGKADFDHAIADFTEAISDYMSMNGPKVAARVAGAFIARAALYLYAKKDDDHVIADATLAIKFSPDSGKAYELRALAYKEKGDTDNAINDFNWAINLSPKDAKLLSERALAYVQKKDYDRALDDYAAAIAIDPKDADIWVQRCYANELKGDDADALANCNEAIRLDPDNAPAIYLRGVAKLGLGDQHGSDEDIARAKVLDPHITK